MKVYLKKVLTAVCVTAVCCFYAYSQESVEESDSSDSVMDLFSDAEDTETPVVTEEVDTPTDTMFNLASLSIPLKMSGDVTAEIGAAYICEDGTNKGSGYFDLKNYLYFTTRPDKYMALKGALKTSMPNKDEAKKDGQNSYFYLYELYFDYLMANKIYITAGKKKSVWGNVRLFCNEEDDVNKNSKDYRDDDAFYTNALYDSRYNISGIVNVSFGPAAITVLAMYNGVSGEPSYKDMSFAGKAEIVLFNTFFNIFGRTFPQASEENGLFPPLPIIGAEIKRSVLGFDVYGQAMGRVESVKTLREFYKSHLYHTSSFDKFIFTGGFYRLWTDSFPYFGINAEYQGIYYPIDKYSVVNIIDNKSELIHEKGDMVHRFMVDLGFAKLGSDRNIKVGVQWYYNITDEEGYVRPGVIISNVFPHCDWNTGIKYEYGKAYDVGKFTLGTYLRFSLKY